MASRLLNELHETAQGLAKVGVVSQTTLREIDAACRPAVMSFSAADVRRIRQQAQVSQAVFAVYLNTSTSTVQKWERGENKPQGSSAKLLDLVVNKGIGILL